MHPLIQGPEGPCSLRIELRSTPKCSSTLTDRARAICSLLPAAPELPQDLAKDTHPHRRVDCIHADAPDETADVRGVAVRGVAACVLSGFQHFHENRVEPFE